MRRLISALLALAFATQAFAAVDPAARGLAIQAKTQAAANTTAVTLLNANTACTRNLNMTSLPIWQKALANQALGLGRAIIAIEDDSTGRGQGAGTGTNGGVGSWSYTPSVALARLFNRVGVTATADSSFGNGRIPSYGNAAGTAQVDSHFTSVGTGWTIWTASNTFGGYFFQNAAVDTSSLVWAPGAIAEDRFDLYYVQGSGNATITVTDSSGTLATINTAGSSGVVKVTVSRAAASTLPISIQRNGTGSNVYLLGIAGYSSASPAVEIYNGSISGSVSADFTSAGNTNPWSPYNVMGAIQPQLTILGLGLNDRNTAVSAATYSANQQANITRAKAYGDVVLVRYVPPDSGWANSSLEASYLAALQALSDSNNIPLIDMTCRWGTWSAANARGLEYDNPHPNKVGYADKAQALFEAVRPR